MLARICLGFGLLLVACGPAWCQASGDGPDRANQPASDSPLSVPPPVSGQAYVSSFTGETESNYLRGGVTFTGAYSNNITGGSASIKDWSYSLWPTIGMEKVNDRMHLIFDYAPGFTIYQNTSSLNQADQNLSANFQYRLTPNLTAFVQEGFHKTSNIFNQPNPLLATPVSGSVPVSGAAVIPPAEDTLTNTTSAQLIYQIAGDSMIGGGGNYNTLSYSSADQNANLYNSRSAGGSLFYSTRLHSRYYLGVSYHYQNFLSFRTATPSTETQTQTIFMFLTVYLKPTLSISISGGPQHYTATQGLLPASSAWQPLTLVSLSWRSERTTFAASYSRTVSGGGGLNGTFHSNNAGMSLDWRASRNWTAGLSGSYANYRTLTPFFLYTSPGGHILSGTASMQRTLSEHMNFRVGYSWVHQSYTDYTTASAYPDSSRAFVSLTYIFSRPLQR